MELETNNPITANGSYTVEVISGRRYTCAISGNFGTGSPSLAFNWVDAAGNKVPFSNSPLTAAAGFEFIAPTDQIDFTLTGSTSPSIYIQTALS